MKKKGFTLTELLVVVVMVGVLAATVLPKFTKVIETQKTLEAEHVMRVVRAEQEARCALDKDYTTNTATLVSWPKSTSVNFTYALTTDGISAASKTKDYTLVMQTYLDGGICCEGNDCSNLNKSYPLCSSYVARKNTACVGSDVPTEKDPTPDPEPQECDDNEPWVEVECACGTTNADFTCNESTGYQWVRTRSDEEECVRVGKHSAPPSEHYECVDITYECVDGDWKEQRDRKEDCDCQPTGERYYRENCECGGQRVTRIWEDDKCQYKNTSGKIKITKRFYSEEIGETAEGNTHYAQNSSVSCSNDLESTACPSGSDHPEIYEGLYSGPGTYNDEGGQPIYGITGSEQEGPKGDVTCGNCVYARYVVVDY